MAAVIVLYTTPDDPEGFDAYYRETHLPLAQELPDLQSGTAQRFVGTPRGTEAPYHVMAELRYASMEAMSASLRSEVGGKVSADAMKMCEQFGARAEIMLADDFS